MKQVQWNDSKERTDQLEKEEFTYLGSQKISQNEKAREVKEHFRKVAKKYDLMNTIFSFGLHQDWKRRAMNQIRIQPGEKVLDICAGTGDLAMLAAGRMHSQGAVYVCDFSFDMLFAGRNRYMKFEEAGCVLPVAGDALKLPFPDNSMDVIVTGFGLRNVTSITTVFREMIRVLKPNGRMMCLEFSKPSNRVWRFLYDVYSSRVMPPVAAWMVKNKESYQMLVESIRQFPRPDELAAAMEKEGFSDISWKLFTGGIAVAHVARKK